MFSLRSSVVGAIKYADQPHGRGDGRESGHGRVPVQPHGRGDRRLTNPDQRSICGSPRRAWGSPLDAGAVGVMHRFTPTGVGTVVRCHYSINGWLRYTPTGMGIANCSNVVDASYPGSPPHQQGDGILMGNASCSGCTACERLIIILRYGPGEYRRAYWTTSASKRMRSSSRGDPTGQQIGRIRSTARHQLRLRSEKVNGLVGCFRLVTVDSRIIPVWHMASISMSASLST